MTSSPAVTLSTPAPVSATTPARSLPWPDGKVAGHRSCRKPCRIMASPGLMPAAFTSTSTSPALGVGRGTSRTSSTSMPPYESNCTALPIWATTGCAAPLFPYREPNADFFGGEQIPQHLGEHRQFGVAIPAQELTYPALHLVVHAAVNVVDQPAVRGEGKHHLLAVARDRRALDHTGLDQPLDVFGRGGLELAGAGSKAHDD